MTNRKRNVEQEKIYATHCWTTDENLSPINFSNLQWNLWVRQSLIGHRSNQSPPADFQWLPYQRSLIQNQPESYRNVRTKPMQAKWNTSQSQNKEVNNRMHNSLFILTLHEAYASIKYGVYHNICLQLYMCNSQPRKW